LANRFPNRMNSTIRAVSSFEDRPVPIERSQQQQSQQPAEEDLGTELGTQPQSTPRDSAFSSSINSTVSSMSSANSQNAKAPSGDLSKKTSTSKLRTSPSKDGLLDAPTPLTNTVKTRSSILDLQAQRDKSNNSPPPTAPIAIPKLEPSSTTTAPDAAVLGTSPVENAYTATEAHLQNGGWDGSIGKAGLGKTGRVINRLVTDNENLKRDIQIERLRAEESRQAARLLEDKLERVIAEYEKRLLEANVTKTLLARKERQVESLQDAIELERKRAVDAQSREQQWKEEMERTKAEAKRQIEEANTWAALCEGRYNAISSHWKDQGEEVKRTVTKVRVEVDKLAEERRRDDEKIETLRELCDQQDGNIRELKRQKEEILAQFERYKAEQEEALREIKRKADEREREQGRMLDEAREVLNKLKWALNVKETIPWAQ